MSTSGIKLPVEGIPDFLELPARSITLVAVDQAGLQSVLDWLSAAPQVHWDGIDQDLDGIGSVCIPGRIQRPGLLQRLFGGSPDVQAEAAAVELGFDLVPAGKGSAGQEQMRALCRSIGADKPLLILVNPALNLDVINVRKLWAGLHKLTAGAVKTVLIITEDTEACQGLEPDAEYPHSKG